ncbi:MAG: hypothetical protein OEV42_14985 [Deltaproteobacteria bacterium]|nr:hypothetical protein [Deltaproteobacteria bacterium]
MDTLFGIQAIYFKRRASLNKLGYFGGGRAQEADEKSRIKYIWLKNYFNSTLKKYPMYGIDEV